MAQNQGLTVTSATTGVRSARPRGGDNANESNIAENGS